MASGLQPDGQRLGLPQHSPATREVSSRFLVHPALVHDLEAVFLYDRIGEHFPGNPLELLLRFVAVPAIQIQHKKFSLAYGGNLDVTQAGERVLNRLALRIEDSTFRHNPDVSFHGVSIAIPLRVFTPPGVRKRLGTLRAANSLLENSVTLSLPLHSNAEWSNVPHPWYRFGPIQLMRR